MITPKNLLIVRTDRIGDVVLSLPMAGIVKSKFPGCRITFLVREYTRALVNEHPDIDSVIILKESKKKIFFRENIEQISKEKFDSCIIVSPNFIISLILFFSKIKNRIGTGYRWYSFLFNHKIFQHRKYSEMHELEFNVKMLSLFGINEKVNKENVHFNLIPADNIKVNELLVENGITDNKPLIIIHPGSGGSAADLPVNKFKELVAKFLADNNIQLIVTGAESEKKLCEAICMSEKIKNFAGMFEIKELISIINKADIFISNSTGPLHIAAALSKIVIGFYPKKLACSAERWGPYSNKSFVFKPNNDCPDCKREQCINTECMNSIDIKEVYTVIKNELNKLDPEK